MSVSCNRRGAGDRAWAGALAFGSGLVVYVGPGASADRHRHDAIQLLVGGDAPVTLALHGSSFDARAAFVPSGAEHSVAAHGRTIVVLVEPVGPVGSAVSRFASGHIGMDVGDRVLELPAAAGAELGVAWSRRTLEDLTGVPCAVNLASVRPEVLALVRYIDQHLDGTPRLGDVADAVGRSTRQLRRDLASDRGMPFRRYVLWRRLRRAVLEVREGHDLTTAAATAGFADSAHFSRVFRPRSHPCRDARLRAPQSRPARSARSGWPAPPRRAGICIRALPLGNTGGANVSAIRPMGIPDDLRPHLQAG